jgi:PAS domain S-box-containing protein
MLRMPGGGGAAPPSRGDTGGSVAIQEGLLTNSPLGFCVFDRSLRFIEVNEALARMNGVAAADHLGRTLREVVPALADQVTPLLERVLESGEPLVAIEVFGETAATPGVRRWWSESFFPVRDGEGEVIGVAAIALEITDRKQNERQLLEARASLEQANLGLEERVAERTRQLAASVSRAEFLAALADSLEAAENPKAVAGEAVERLMALLKARAVIVLQLQGERLCLLERRGPAPGLNEEMMANGIPLTHPSLSRQVLASGVARYTLDYRSEAGGSPTVREWLAGAFEPVRVRDGRIVGVLCVWREPQEGSWLPEQRDLLARAAATIGLALERAENQAALAERNRLLEERTRELAARNSDLETFVYTVSHDLRSPITALRGITGLLEESLASDDRVEASFLITRVASNLKRFSDLLDDLLALSRVGRVDEEVYSLDLGEVIGEVLADLAHRVEASGAQVRVAPEWPRVRSSRTEATQLLLNLIANALKYGRKAGQAPRIEINWTTEDGFLTVRVSDDGPGIPGQYRAKVFELFQKLEARSDGTGVGLAIVKRIAERHGGKAWVEESPGGGAVFLVTLPLERRSPGQRTLPEQDRRRKD